MKIAYFLAFVLVLASCKQNDPRQMEAREQLKAILAVHDEIMPQTMSISRKVDQLQARVDSTEQSQAFASSIVELDQAYEGMNDWMKEFHDLYGDVLMGDNELSPEQLDALQPQQEKVEALKDLYIESFRRADSLLALDQAGK